MLELIKAYESIGSSRKAAWFKRELVGVIVERVVRFGEKISLEQRNETIKLLESVCRTFRIPSDPLDDEAILLDYRRGVIHQVQPGWRELQLGLLMDAVIACHLLGENQNELKFRLKLTELMVHHKLDDFQIQHHFTRTRWLLYHLDKPLVKYWGPKQIILALELMPLSDRQAVIPHLKPIQSPVEAQSDTHLDIPTFYYYPNRLSTGLGKDKGLSIKMIQYEPITVWVTLQNPFQLELDIDMICLSTTGIPFNAIKSQTVIQPQTLRMIPLTGIPLSTGILKIKGCRIQLIGAQNSQEFTLPVGKSKLKKKTEQDEFISCEVIEPMPFLRITSDCEESIRDRGVMVYDGEKTIIEMKILNTSSVRADWLEVIVQDNLSEGIRKRLEEKMYQLDEFEQHEIEYELIKQAPLRVIESSKSIEAHQTGLVRLECLGKMGCKSLKIIMDYGIQPPSSLNHDHHHFKRQMIFNLDLSVQKSLNLVEFKTLPHGFMVFQVQNSNHAGQVFEVEAKLSTRPQATSKEFIKNNQKQIIQPGSTRAFLLEIEPIQITQLDLEKAIPGLIKRQFILHRQKEPQLHADEEGYPADKLEQVALKEEGLKKKMQAENKLKYLLKEEVFKAIRLQWREIGSNRSGEICLRREIRNFNLDNFIHHLRSDQIDIHLSFQDSDLFDHLLRSHPISLKTDHCYPMHVHIKNRSGINDKVKLKVKITREDGTEIKPRTNDCQMDVPAHHVLQGVLHSAESQDDFIYLTDDHRLELTLLFFSSGSFLLNVLALASRDSTLIGCSNVIKLIVS